MANLSETIRYFSEHEMGRTLYREKDRGACGKENIEDEREWTPTTEVEKCSTERHVRRRREYVEKKHTT